MSLVGTWVLAVDGNLYFEPVIRSKAEIWQSPHGGPVEREKWFLCFDDEEPPELVIALQNYQDELPCKLTAAGVMDRAREILNWLNLRYKLISKRPKFSGRDFGGVATPDRCHTQQAGAVFVKLESPLPIPQEGLFGKRPKGWQEEADLGCHPEIPCVLESEDKATVSEAMARGEACFYLFDDVIARAAMNRAMKEMNCKADEVDRKLKKDLAALRSGKKP